MNRQKDRGAPSKSPLSSTVSRGNVTATLIHELVDMCRELDQRRMLADDLEAWFAKNPQLSELFGAFQLQRQEERRAAQQRAHAAANAKRRAR